MARILVLNLTRMGDILQSGPLISGLRERHPQAEIGLLVQEAFAAAAHTLPGVDRVLTIDHDRAVGLLMDPQLSLGRQCGWFHTLVRELRGEGWDLVLNLSHSRDSAVLARLLSRGEVRGIVAQSDGGVGVASDWARLFFCTTGNRSTNQFNLVDLYRLLGGLDGGAGHMGMSMPQSAQDAVAELLKPLDPGRPLLLVQAGASRENRRWPVERMAAVMGQLHALADCSFALTGSKGERALCASLFEMVRELPVVDLAGRTSLTELGALCRRAALLITNDTGTLHVAAANGLPSVSLFIATAWPWETAPWLPGCLILHPDLSCAPCSHHVVCPHIQCRDMIPLEGVRDAALELLARQALATRPQDDWFRRPGLRVFETSRPEAGWQELKELGRESLDLAEWMAQAYRRLWLERLEPALGRREEVPHHAGLPLRQDQASLVVGLLKGLQDVQQAAQRGEGLVESIHHEMDRSAPRAARLNALTAELSTLDDRLFELELGQPLLRPLGVMYRLAKEALQATEDLRELGAQSLGLYRELAARALRLAELLADGSAPRLGNGNLARHPVAAPAEERLNSCTSW